DLKLNPNCIKEGRERIRSPSQLGHTMPWTETSLENFSLKIFKFIFAIPVDCAAAPLFTPLIWTEEGVREGGGSPASRRLDSQPPPRTTTPAPVSKYAIALISSIKTWIRRGDPVSDVISGIASTSVSSLESAPDTGWSGRGGGA